jgi:MFS family permease
MTENRLKTSLSLVPSVSVKTVKHFSLIPWLICGLGAVYYCYEYFLRISPSVMTHELMREYNLTAAQVGSLSAFYYHAYVPMQIVVGLLMDRYGPRRLLTLACMLCAFGTYLFASGYSLLLAEAGRFLVGFGSAFAFVGALKLATIWLPPNRFALVSGIILCLGMMGAMVGDIVLRALVDAVGWQVTIYASAVSGVLLTAVLWTAIRDSNPAHTVQQSTHLNFAGLFMGLLDALKNPQIWLNGLVGLLLYLSLSSFAELWAIPYLEQARGLSKVDAAYVNSMIFLGWAVGGPFWGWFSDHLQRRCLPITVSSSIAVFLVCILLYAPNLSLSWLYGLMFVFGLLSSVQILVFSICRETTNIKIAGTAIALTNMLVMVGGNFFQPVVGTLLDLSWSGEMLDGVRVYSPHAYQLALSVLPIGIVLAVILMFFVRETHAEIHINDLPETKAWTPKLAAVIPKNRKL